MRLWKDYFLFLSQVKKTSPSLTTLVILNLLVTIFFVMVTVAVPYAFKLTLDIISSPSARQSFTLMLGMASLYGGIWMLNQVLQWVRTLLSVPLLASCDAASQKLLFLHLIKVPFEMIKNSDIGTRYATLTRCRHAFSTLSFTLLWAVIPVFLQTLLGCSLIFVVISWQAGLCVLLAALGLLGWSMFFSAKTLVAHQATFQADNLLATHFQERMSSLVEIKTNSAYAKERAEMDRVAAQYQQKILLSNTRVSWNLIVQAAVSGIIFIIINVIAAYFVYRGHMTLGNFVLISGYAASLMAPIDALASSFSELRKNHLALREGLRILRMATEDERAIFRCPIAEVMTVKDYPVPGSDKRINFRLEQGQCALLMGRSGGGKTTLLHILVGLQTPGAGEFRLWGDDIRQLSPAAIGRFIAFVAQEPTLFSGTVKDNLLYASQTTVDDRQLSAVLAGVALATLGGGDPLGYDIGWKGDRLSVGEKRRLAIARALVRDVPILILDEPTAGLDEQTEQQVLAYLTQQGKTLLIASHSMPIKHYASWVCSFDDVAEAS